MNRYTKKKQKFYLRYLSSNFAKTISKFRIILSNVNLSTVTVPGVWALLDEINKKKNIAENE
jgi:hypothetical protein